jgi:prevent-host-death family protein
MTISIDYGTMNWSKEGSVPGKAKKAVREVAISEFKAKCLSLVDQVNKTKTPLRITRRGVPVAEVVPVSPETDRSKWLGSMAGILKITGDIVSPVIDADSFEALKD